MLACLLRPLTLRLARRMPLGVAAALTVGVVLAGFALVTAVEIRDLVAETNRLKEAVPARIEEVRLDLEPDHAVRRFIEQAEVEPRVREWLGQLPARVVLGTDNPAEGASRVTGALLVTILTMFTITRGSQTVHGGARPRSGTSGSGGRWSGSCGPPTEGGTALHRCGPWPWPSCRGSWPASSPTRSTYRPRRCSACGSAVWSLIPVLGLVDRLPAGHRAGGGRAAQQGRDRLRRPASSGSVLAALARRRWIARHSVDVSRLLLTLAVMTGLHVGRITGAMVGVFLAAAIGGGAGRGPAPERVG